MSALGGAMRSAPGRGALRRGPEPVRGGPPSFAASVELADALDSATMAILAPDAYTVTSEILAFGVERLLESPPDRRGILAPSQVVSAEEALRTLERRGALAVLAPRHDYK